MTKIPHGTPIRVYPSGQVSKHAQPKPARVVEHHQSSLPKSDLVSVRYDDGSPREIVPVSHVEMVP